MSDLVTDKRIKKLGLGLLNALQGKGEDYNSADWWDDFFYTKGISDRQTIAPEKNIMVAIYHYASVELQILRYLYNNQISIQQSKILDIGSGAGHWIDFYKSLGASKITGVDISKKCVEYLKEKYRNDTSIWIYQNSILSYLGKSKQSHDIVNAVGIMYHIVDDKEWENTFHFIKNRLKTGGLFVASGHFGYLDGLNVQIVKGETNKRLRSKRHWKKVLKKAGFDKIKVLQNDAYKGIDAELPENNILMATKI